MGFLRFFLAISVLIAHSTSFFNIPVYSGACAVSIFFIISGFYMQLISNKYGVAHRPWKDFYLSRFFKIFPIYWAVLFSTILIPWLLSVDYDKFILTEYWIKYYSNLSNSSLSYLIFSNIFIFTQEFSFIFSLGNEAREFIYNPMKSTPTWLFFPIPQAWTLSLEVTFYLLFPLIANLKTTNLVKLFSIVIVLHVIILLFFNNIYNSGTYRFFPTAIRFFLVGMVAFRSVSYFERKGITHNLIWLVIFYCVHLIILKRSFEFGVLSIALALPALFCLTKNSFFDKKIGEFSFTIYMVHLLVIECLKKFEYLYSSTNAIVISIILAYFIQLAIVKPIDNYRLKFGARKVKSQV